MQQQAKATILVADDEAVNLTLLSEYLSSSGYRLVMVKDGAEAWDRLRNNPREFDVVLLDLMMPHLDGLEVLRRIKSDDQLQILPVVLQTALNSPADIHEGIRAGAYYYLTKPLEKEMLGSVVATAVQDHLRYRRMQDEIDRTSQTFGLLRSAEFRFRTLDEGRALATLLANACPHPRKAVVGISELLVNAVEHGNLGIGYAEKTRLLERDDYSREVERRLQSPAYQNRQVSVTYQRAPSAIMIRIRDQGAGFDWRRYAEVDADRVFDVHGRGIAVARITSFDDLKFLGRGNEVLGTIRLDG
jgi:CheY-like chemotaxis protein